MNSHIMCIIIQPQKFLMIYTPVYSRTAVSTGKSRQTVTLTLVSGVGRAVR